jgi:hypothetical protein
MGTRRDCITGVAGIEIGICADCPHDRQDGDCTTGATGTGAGATAVMWKGDVCIDDCTIGGCMYPDGAP